MQNRLQQNFSGESATDMALQQVSLSGVIICPDQELEQRFAVNSFTVHLFYIIKATGPKQRIIQMWCVSDLQIWGR